MHHPLAGQRVRHGIGWIRLIDQSPQILPHTLRQRLRIWVVLHHREAAPSNASLQRLQTPLLCCPLARIHSALPRRPLRITEIEERPASHLWVVQHPVQDLQLGDTLATPVLLQPRLLHQQRKVILSLLGHPAVAFPQKADEVGPGTVDFGQTDRQHLALLSFLLGDAPPQIHVHQSDLALPAFAAKLREDLSYQQIPLQSKVPKR